MKSTLKSYNKIFFPNLDALRFGAFFLVFLAHVLLIHLSNEQTYSYSNYIRKHAQTGVLGVNFFFVLSGFLITFLLLKEKISTGKFNIIKFYVRRVLRIWPVYFVIVIFSFVVLPLVFPLFNKTFFEPSPLVFYLTFTANFAFIMGYYPHSSLLIVLWSIAVEEQFYFFWPWLLKFFKQNILLLLILIIIVNVIARFLFLDNQKALYCNTLSIISDFGIGGIIAYFSLYKTEKLIAFFSVSKIYWFIFYLGLFAVIYNYEKIFTGNFMTVIERPVLGIFFGLIIIDQCFNNKRIFNAGRFVFVNYLGKISYGLYCYHPLGIIIAKHVLDYFNFFGSPLQSFIVFPALSLLFSVLIASISYFTIEKYFLKQKEKFSS